MAEKRRGKLELNQKTYDSGRYIWLMTEKQKINIEQETAAI